MDFVGLSASTDPKSREYLRIHRGENERDNNLAR